MLVFLMSSVFLFLSFIAKISVRPLLLRWSSSQLCLKLDKTSMLRLASRVSALERLTALPIAHICLRPPPAAMD